MAKSKNKLAQKMDYIWAVLRIGLGSTFLGAFFDKAFGLGQTTCRLEDGTVETMCDAAWLQGGSPTADFLNFGTKGPFQDFFQGLAGNPVAPGAPVTTGNPFIDWLFMLGLLGIGVALMLGIAVKIGVISAVAMYALMYAASSIWPEHHPFINEHVVYAVVLIGVYCANGTQRLGFGKWWKKQTLVKKYSILE